MFGVVLIALLALVNVRGVKDAVSVNIVLAVVDFLSQSLLVLHRASSSCSARRCWSTT